MCISWNVELLLQVHTRILRSDAPHPEIAEKEHKI